MKSLYLCIVCLLLLTCKKKDIYETNTSFKLPEIINTGLQEPSSYKFEAKSISEVLPRFIGKYKFADTIDINPLKRETYEKSDYVGHYLLAKPKDTVDVNGFEMIADYSKTVKFCKSPKIDSTVREYYPVYLVNSTQTPKLFPLKDNYIFGIQEAQSHQNGYRWRPIEVRGFDFCGNGHWAIIVHPNEFVVTLMRKYKGDFETEIRVRAKVGESIYISKPFVGNINKDQFLLKEDSYIKSRLIENNVKSISLLFYGATPNPNLWTTN